MSELLLGIDVGTYSSKAVVVTPEGEIVASSRVDHQVSIPQVGWAEHDPEGVWWNDVVALCRMIFDDGAVDSSDLAAVALSAIGPCLVTLDDTNRPLRPAILYGIDTRAGQEIRDLERQYGRVTLRARFNMDLTTQAVVPKILWLQRHEPHVWGRTARIGTASSYLVSRLTNEHVIDRHTAGHFLPLFDPVSGTWTDEFSGDLVSPHQLPALGWSDDIAGEITKRAAEETGLPAGIPVAVGAVDALSEALSVGLGQPGELMIMYGSTTFFILFTERPETIEGMWSLPGAFAGQHVVAGGMATTGALTRWFVEELAREYEVDDAYAKLFEEAGEIEPGSEGLIVLPYFSGERTPLNDPDARGVIAGLTLSHRRQHLFRAVLEGVAFGIRHNLEVFERSAGLIESIAAVGGGTTSGLWPGIVSDVCQRPQSLPRIRIGASYGDAYIAGLAAGVIERDAIGSWAAPDTVVTPNPDLAGLYDNRYAAYRLLYENTLDIVHRLSAERIANEQASRVS